MVTVDIVLTAGCHNQHKDLAVLCKLGMHPVGTHFVVGNKLVRVIEVSHSHAFN